MSSLHSPYVPVPGQAVSDQWLPATGVFAAQEALSQIMHGFPMLLDFRKQIQLQNSVEVVPREDVMLSAPPKGDKHVALTKIPPNTAKSMLF